MPQQTRPIVYTIILSCSTLFISGCAPTIPNNQLLDKESTPSLSSGSQYSFSFLMENPGTSNVNNLMMMQNGYSTQKEFNYTITSEDVEHLKSYGEYCVEPVTITNGYLGELDSYPSKELVEGKTLNLTAQYSGSGLGLTFSSDQLTSLHRDGFLLMEANNELLTRITNGIPYSDQIDEAYTPEWAYYYNLLGGPDNEVQRYPYNTIYVSSDLLLHSYHKLFSNTLKSYEMTIARDLLYDVIDESLRHFSKLSQEHSGKPLQSYYDYITAYWTIAKILLPSAQEFDTIRQNSWSNYDDDGNNTILDNGGNIKDEYLKKYLIEQLNAILLQYPTQYNNAVRDSIKEILSGTESKQLDHLSNTFSPQTNPEFVITQDYTQFVPRGYYTDNVELQTYFMAMKWLMRHKFYSRDINDAQASLLLVQSMPTTALEKIGTLQDFIVKMIGEDDDITIQDMKGFLQEKKMISDQDIFSIDPKSWQSDLMVLHPQRIISTSYITPSEGSTTEAQAKEITAGFVFFGEKFTSDSRIMDELTAGSAEQEASKKPDVVSVYQIRDTLMGGRLSEVQYRRSLFATKYGISSAQQLFYPELRDQTHLQLSQEKVNKTIYTDRIHLAKSSTLIPNQAPAYMSAKKFWKKIQNTVLGTYTELKHDTILYVKQAYAELGAGGDMCSIFVDVPELPVPKGYVEPQIDMMDHLITLAQDTQLFFGEINKDNFNLFIDYLKFVREIAIQQTNNSVISDEDFERLRTSYTLLSTVLSPAPDYRSSGERGTRSAVITDIFTSGAYGPYYLATGRPLLMIVLIDDINGKRAVIGPVYSTYEFYGNPIPSQAGRYTDQEWRNAYDNLKNKEQMMTLPLQSLLNYK